MSISSAVLWQGGFIETYVDELNAELGPECVRVSLADRAEPRLPAAPPRKPRETEAAYADRTADHRAAVDAAIADHWLDSELNDESLWLEDDRELLIDHAEAWSGAALAATVRHAAALETGWTLHLVQRNFDELPAEVMAAVGEVRDRGIPGADTPADRRAWVLDWLAARRVDLAESAATRLVEHTARDNEALVSVVRYLAAGYRNEEAGWGDILPQLGQLGEVPIFDLVNAIAAGRRDEALIIARRIRVAAHPLQVIALLVNRYRQYATFVDFDRDPEAHVRAANPDIVRRLDSDNATTAANARKQLNGKVWALRKNRGEAQTLGRERVIRGYALVAAAERDLKGGSRAEPEDILDQLVVRLAQQFARAAAAD